MIWFKQNPEVHHHQLTLVYRAMRTTRQAVSQYLNRKNRHCEEELTLIPIIKDIREDHPRMGLRHIYRKLSPKTMGRDLFIEFARQYNLVLPKSKSPIRTTWSLPGLTTKNLVLGLEVTRVNQLWVSDITYFWMGNHFAYLTFIMDMFSRKILSAIASQTLLADETVLPALKKAIKVRNNEIPPKLILHSDGGGQYFSHNVLTIIKKYTIQSSRAQSCYENANAERINGTIKNDYLIPKKPQSFSELSLLLKKTVYLYNHEKTHSSLNNLTPDQFEYFIYKSK